MLYTNHNTIVEAVRPIYCYKYYTGDEVTSPSYLVASGFAFTRWNPQTPVKLQESCSPPRLQPLAWQSETASAVNCEIHAKEEMMFLSTFRRTRSHRWDWRGAG